MQTRGFLLLLVRYSLGVVECLPADLTARLDAEPISVLVVEEFSA